MYWVIWFRAEKAEIRPGGHNLNISQISSFGSTLLAEKVMDYNTCRAGRNVVCSDSIARSWELENRKGYSGL